jgi:hypothetical protein
MVASKKQTLGDANQEQRDTITRMEVTINEVVIPSIKRVEESVTTLTSKDLIGRQEADLKYMTKSDFRPYAVAITTIGGIFLATIAGSLAKLVLK